MARQSKSGIRFVKTKGFLLLVTLFIFVLLLTFFFGDSGVVEIVKAQGRIDALRENIARLEAQKEKLEREIKELQDNPLALEKTAREKLWLMKKNEKVVVIVRDKAVDEGKDQNPRGKSGASTASKKRKHP